jgi:hypothetical protein
MAHTPCLLVIVSSFNALNKNFSNKSGHVYGPAQPALSACLSCLCLLLALSLVVVDFLKTNML